MFVSQQKNAHGEVLFGKVIENLDIVDKEYFGLRFLKSLTSSKVCMEYFVYYLYSNALWDKFAQYFV